MAGLRVRAVLRRVSVSLGILLGGLVLLVLGVLVLFQFRGIREGVLVFALERVDGALPGSLGVGTATWPKTGTLVLEEVTWEEESVPLASVGRASVSVGLLELLRRDVIVHRLELEGLAVDVPALQSAFTKGPEEPERTGSDGEAEGDGEPFFPREGALPGLPSLAVHDLVISGGGILLPDSSRIDTLQVALALEARAGKAPGLEVLALRAGAPEVGWEISETRISADPDGRIRGESRGRLTPEWPYRFSLEGRTAGSFELALALGEPGQFEDPLGIEVAGTMERNETRVNRATFTAGIAIPSVRELARVPGLRAVLAGMPDLDALLATVEAELVFEPEFAAEAEVSLKETSQILGGAASVRYEAETLTVDPLSLDLQDLRLRARGRLGSEVDASVRAEVTGLGWLAMFGAVPAYPETLDLVLEGSAKGPRDSPGLDARVQGSLGGGGFDVTGLDLTADAPALFREPVAVLLAADIPGAGVEVALDVSLGEVIEAQAAPIRFHAPGDAERTQDSNRDGVIRFDPKAQRLEASGFRIRGTMGEIDVDGEITRFREGTATLGARFPEAPAILGRLLEPEVLDSLAVRWREDGPFTVDAEARFSERATGTGIAVAGEFLLPGPRTLAPVLPAGAAVDTLGPLRGTAEVDIGLGKGGTALAARVDPSATDWIERSRLEVEVAGDSLVLDQVSLALLGLELELQGRRVAEAWDLDGRVDVRDATLLKQLVPAFRDSAVMELRADLAFHGTREVPDLQASLWGFLESGPVTLDSLSAEAIWNERGFDARLALPEGAVAKGIVIDSLAASYVASDAGLVPGVFRLDGSGPDFELTQVLRVERDPGWRVSAESLLVVIPEGDLATQGPFTVAFQAGGGFLVEDLRLAGSLGQVVGRARVAPDSSDIQVDMSVAMPQEPRSTFVVPGLWPKTVEMNVHSGEAGSLGLRARAEGLEMGGRTGLVAALEVRADTSLTRGEFQLQGEDQALVASNIQIPARFDVYPFTWVPGDDPVSGRVDLTDLRIAWERVVPGSVPGQIVFVDGTVDVAGTLARLEGSSELTMRLPEDSNHPEFLMRVDAEVRPVAAGDGNEKSALRSGLRLDRGQATVLTGRLEVPVLHFGAGPDQPVRTVDLEIRSEPLQLEEFAPFLPTNLSLGGRMECEFTAEGPMRDPTLGGRVSVNGLEVDQAKGANATGNADIRVSGTGRKPVVEGTVEILSGTIPIPEKSKDILPDEGQSELWAVRGRPPLREDMGDTLSGETAETARVEPDLDITINVPSGLWMRGKQMRFELSGDLNIVYRDGAPTVTGRLKTQQGQFSFLGRTFTPERGEVIFYGQDELNPSLDIRLTTRVESYEIAVSISRTALEPKIELSSVPDLSQGDIMSVLTFGKPANELDGDQTDLMAQRAAAIAATYGSAELEQAVAGPLGLDMVSYNPSGREGKSSVVVGKYLNPRTLLKYEQALDSGAGFFVSLEYSLRVIRNMKVETVVGTRQSGGEISWSRDY